MSMSLPVLPRALDLDRPQATFREQPEDFYVEEVLGFEPDGDGEHLWLFLEKTNLNTQDVVKIISEHTGIKSRDIGFSGMKDRKAVTRQWFSVKAGDSFKEIVHPGLKLLEQKRNSRKLKRGVHRQNRFRIRLRNIAVNDCNEVLQVGAHKIRSSGVPNYFGLQRFGKEGANLDKALAFFSGSLKKYTRYQRGIYLSAARAYLFNQVLAKRVKEGNWNGLLEGDVMALNGSSSVFASETGDEQLAGRLDSGDIHPTGPLWGAGKLQSQATVMTLENSVASEFSDLAEGLAQNGLKQERRPLRVSPVDFAVSREGEEAVMVEFALSRGSYATSVLRELVEAPGL